MPKVTGKSLPVRTRWTPGCLFAFSTSIERIFACACGDRSNLACTMRGRTMSSAKRVWPVTFARPSTRRRGLPMTFIDPPRRFLDGLVDLLIAGATAQISGNGFLDPLPGRILLVLEERLRAQEDA